MSQFDFIQAAKSLDLPVCRSVRGSGESLILEECVHTSGQTRRCDFWIWSATNHPHLQRNLQPSAFSQRPHPRILNKEWTPVEPVAHVSNLKLIGKFKEIFLKHFNITLHNIDIFDQNPIDRLSLLAYLISRTHEFGKRQLSNVLTSLKENGLFSYALTWIDYLKYFAISIGIFIILSVVIRIIASCNPLPSWDVSSTLHSPRLQIGLTSSRWKWASHPTPWSRDWNQSTTSSHDRRPEWKILWASERQSHTTTVLIGNRLLWEGCLCETLSGP